MDDLKAEFQRLHPGIIYLEPELSTELTTYLRSKNLLRKEEHILSLEKPGEGNMNRVLRVISNQRSFILKQARPWVEKYPQVAAPVARLQTEENFYQTLRAFPFFRSYTPTLLGYDPSTFILALEDLGEGADYSFLYQENRLLGKAEIEKLLGFLSELHQIKSKPSARRMLGNQEMKKLNHEHIFVFPFLEENGFDLDTVQPGLQAASLPYKIEEELKKRIRLLGEQYLDRHITLLHGDYYPGSWLKVKQGMAIIDPEFAHYGRAEFELGVMLAHLKMSQHPDELIDFALSQYRPASRFDEALCWSFVGTELMRRIIGLAQLPLSLHLEEKKSLLEEAHTYILSYKP